MPRSFGLAYHALIRCSNQLSYPLLIKRGGWEQSLATPLRFIWLDYRDSGFLIRPVLTANFIMLLS